MKQGAISDDTGLPPRRRSSDETVRRNWFSEPKTAIWIALGVALLFGGGRKLSAWWKARKAVARLGESDVTSDEIEEVAEHGRAGVYELLRIFSSSPDPPARRAAGRALARLWLLDQLVAEEEQAIIRRGYSVTWNARRRYPRALVGEIPITVSYDVPFLEDGGRRVGPANLAWSHRVTGARRAALEEFSPWTTGPGRGAFSIFPGDFETNGPHRLVLQTRIRTTGLTDSWELEPPHEPFSFEFDPNLRLDALLALPDAARDELVSQAIRLERTDATGESERANYLALSAEWTIRNPPTLAVRPPLPSDLAHTIWLEFEGIEGRFGGGTLVLSGQGLPKPHSPSADAVTRLFALGPVAPLPSGVIERPGTRQMRAWLEPNLERGWADPKVRSIWPGKIHTNWVDVQILRR